MTLSELIAIIVSLGGISSILTSVVTRAHWPSWLRLVASVAVSALVGASGYLGTHDWHVQSLADLIALIVGILTGAWVTYQSVFKPLGVAAAVEKATTPDAVLAANAPVVVPVVDPSTASTTAGFNQIVFKPADPTQPTTTTPLP